MPLGLSKVVYLMDQSTMTRKRMGEGIPLRKGVTIKDDEISPSG